LINTYRFRIRAGSTRLALHALAVLAGGAVAFGQGALVVRSPFGPAGGAAGGAGGTPEAYELAGSTVQGKDVAVCIFERQAKHTRWIPVGGITDGIRVISFDAAHDVAVVSVEGAIKELTMRKPTIAPLGSQSMAVAEPAAPAPPPAQIVGNAAGGAPKSAQAIAQEQREARMLVSDLLEIGVQQRKAYQEAKRKGADASPQPSN
jgi:hypothetical protein